MSGVMTFFKSNSCELIQEVVTNVPVFDFCSVLSAQLGSSSTKYTFLKASIHSCDTPGIPSNEQLVLHYIIIL